MKNLRLDIINNFEDVIKDYIINEIFIEKIYDFDAFGNQNITIIDCGANVGYSIIYFKNKFPNSTIYAFEPDPIAFELLIRNIHFNKINNVYPLNKGVSNSNTKQDFYILNTNTFRIPVMSFYPNEFAQMKIIVETINFGSFVNQFEVIDFCKVDIEGGESLILQSLIEKNTLSKVKEFVFEYHHWIKQLYTLEEFTHLLEINNFDCSIIKNEPPIDGWSISGNTIIRAKNKLFLYLCQNL
jgi:FkbM family methyltransferase